MQVHSAWPVTLLTTQCLPKPQYLFSQDPKGSSSMRNPEDEEKQNIIRFICLQNSGNSKHQRKHLFNTIHQQYSSNISIVSIGRVACRPTDRAFSKTTFVPGSPILLNSVLPSQVSGMFKEINYVYTMAPQRLRRQVLIRRSVVSPVIANFRHFKNLYLFIFYKMRAILHPQSTVKAKGVGI